MKYIGSVDSCGLVIGKLSEYKHLKDALHRLNLYCISALPLRERSALFTKSLVNGRPS